MEKTAKVLSKYWWSSIIIGIFYITLGLWFLTTPVTALNALKYLFIIGFIVSGVVDILYGLFASDPKPGRVWNLVAGFVDIIFGLILLTISLPVLTTLILYIIGFWILLRSIWTISTAIDMRKKSGAGLLLLLGVVSLILSLLYLFSPIYGGVLVMTLACLAFVAYGVFRIFYAFRLRDS